MQLATLQGPDQSSSTNATGWTCLLAPPLVNVTSEGPPQLWASWVHASRGRDSYQVTLYQAGTQASTQASTSAVGAKVASTSFLSLTPGTKYEVEVVMQAGPLHTAAANTSGWTCEAWGRQRCRRALCPPSELLVSRHASTTVVSLAWVSGPLGAHSLGAGRGSQLSECCARWGRCRRPLTAWCCLLVC